MKILVTGCCGFIGFHLSKKLLQKKNTKIIGIDNINNYYDTKLKKDRLKILKNYNNFVFYKLDITNLKKLNKLFKKYNYKTVVHLAAQAGVRYSIENPNTYFNSNVAGFFNILSLSKEYKINHLIYASTSSVYGASKKFPLTENMTTDYPLSFYAATKKTNEIMAYSFSNVYKLRTTGLRFFTVYGPYGRPDMSLFKFVKNIILGKPIQLFNKGLHQRDFTYIDDVVSYINFLIFNKNINFGKDKVPYEIYNIGNGKTVKLLNFIEVIQNNLFKKAKIKKYPLQKGDVKKTHANVGKINKLIKINKTDVKTGVEKFIKWYKGYIKSQ